MKESPPPVYQQATYTECLYLHNKFCMEVESWYTGGWEAMFYKPKKRNKIKMLVKGVGEGGSGGTSPLTFKSWGHKLV